MPRFISILSGLFILVLLSSLSLAGIPKLINYQGMLTDNSGTPLTGSYNLTFKIWTDTTGGSSLWTETQNGVQVQNGLFNVMLGRSTTLNLAFDQQYWLEVAVGAETMPRIRFTSVGYAYRAAIADSATVAVSAPTGGGWTDDGAVVRLTMGTDNVGIGTASPSAKLDVSGDINTSTFYKIAGNVVLQNSGTENISVGDDAGENNTGIDATFVGYKAGYKNQGEYNTFLGHYAGYNNTSGFRNTFVGDGAGISNIDGTRNTFLGNASGSSNNSGYYNTFVGQATGLFNTTGNNNTFLGLWAGSSNTTGSRNTYLGAEAGELDSTGSGNVFIGYKAGSNETGSNKLYVANSDANPPLIYGDFSAYTIGLGTKTPGCALHILNSSSYFGMLRIQNSNTGNNEATMGFIGGSDVGHETWLAGIGAWSTGRDFVIGLNGAKLVITAADGNVGIGTANPGSYKLAVNGSAAKPGGGSWDVFSDLRLKEIKAPYEYGLTEISRLNPVHYRYKEGNALGLPAGKEYAGLVAQDVEGVIPDAIEKNEQGYLMLNNDPIIWAMLNAIKELKAENEQLRKRVEALESR